MLQWVRLGEVRMTSSFSGMRGIATVPSYVIMQPTTLCNLDCTYCYLPLRAADRRMPVEVAQAVAETVNPWAGRGERFSVVWHGGEPLTAGRAALAGLMAPFSGVEHHVQTNATLIDDAWCEFFREHEVRLGVSVDGPEEFNGDRRDRGGRSAYRSIAEGIATLRGHDIPFAALCVVSDPRPELAAPLYRYFRDLGCYALGINIEEREGVNLRGNAHDPSLVRGFWSELTAAWRADRAVELRDVEWAIRYASALATGAADDVLPRQLDPIPTIGVDGSVVLLSPELAGFSAPQYGDFASGNVLRQPLRDIVAGATQDTWIAEYLAGVEACRDTCAYFGFCGGGHAANRFFESGRFDITETEHCRNSKIFLMEGVLDHAIADRA
jgi:uncharacterized protein